MAAPIILCDTAGMTNEQWLEARMHGPHGKIPYTVGGSDVAAIFGVSPWTTPLELWNIKKGRMKPPKKANANQLEMGHLLEPIAAHWYAKKTGNIVTVDLKIHSLGLCDEVYEKLYDLLECQEFFLALKELMDAFAAEHNYRWQVGMNGRSGGYLVLYQGEIKPSGYKSFCTACGQLNYRSIKETGKQCGKCGLHTRVDFDKPHMQVSTFPGRGTDDDADFTDWSMDELRNRVRLVQEFDCLADRIVDRAIDIAKHYSVEEEEYYVPKVRKVLVPAGA